MTVKTGTMTTDAELLGVYGMRLKRGQRVKLVDPDNIPKAVNQQWFASPLDGKWSDGVDRPDADSILIESEDVIIDQ